MRTTKILKNEHMSKKALIWLLIILLLMTSVSFYKQYKKEAFHIDEMLTYVLANNTKDTELVTNQKIENSKTALESFLTVNDTNPPFNYHNVWENQHGDTHPPLYYFLVHTICSFFPNIFSKWFAYSVNIIFANLVIIFFYKVVRIGLKKSENVSILMTALMALNPAFIEITVFLRMYVMAMFWCVLLTYWLLRFWGHFSRKFFIGNALILLAGTLTHYYFIIYAFFSYCVLAIYLLKQRETRKFVYFLASSITGTLATILIFPGIGYHLLKQGRGKENIENFLQTSNYMKRIASYFKLIGEDVFVNYVVMFILIIVSIIGFMCFWKKLQKTDHWRLLCIIFPSIGYFLVVSIVASYITDRYMVLVYPIMILSVYMGIYFLGETALKNMKQYTLVICGSVLILLNFAGYYGYSWDYNIEGYTQSIKPVVEENAENDCICIYSDITSLWPIYVELIQYNTVTFINFGDEQEIDTSNYNGDKTVVYLPSNMGTENIEMFIKKFKQYDGYSVVHDSYADYNAFLLN